MKGKPKSDNSVYVLASADEYELPLAVTDTCAQLSRILKTDSSCISHTSIKGTILNKRFNGIKCKVIKVNLQ